MSDMSKQSAIAVLLSVLILLAGCSAITGSAPDDPSQHRFVVENGYAEAQNITVTIDTNGGGPVITETRHVMAGEQWILTTLNVSVMKNGYTMTVLTRGNEILHEANSGGSGATLVVVGGGQILTCGGTLTCYNETT
jgi:uncharacterized Fe-S center protein